MSEKREKLSILQTLTVSNLKEICEKNNLKGYSRTKKNWLTLWPLICGFLHYYEIWERILKRLGKEFVNILKETSFSQVKNTELKDDLLKMLKVK